MHQSVDVGLRHVRNVSASLCVKVLQKESEAQGTLTPGCTHKCVSATTAAASTDTRPATSNLMSSSIWRRASAVDTGFSHGCSCCQRNHHSMSQAPSPSPRHLLLLLIAWRHAVGITKKAV